MKNRRLLFILLIAVSAAVFIWLVFRLAPSASVDTAPVVLPTVDPTADGDAGDAPDKGTQTVSVTPDTVQTVVAQLRRADSYARTVTVETFWSGGSSTAQTHVWVQGDRARFTVAGAPEKNILIDGDELWIWYSDSRRVFHGAADDSAADEYQALLTYEHIMAIDKADILDAGYTDYDGTQCIFASYQDGELGYVSRFWVSVETGLLMAAETLDGEQTVYRMQSTLPDISTQDESLFSPP